jgi:malonyl-ACP decarboxylase
MDPQRAVCITGIGVTTCLGSGAPAFADGLRRGVSGITRREGATPELGGFLPHNAFVEHVASLPAPAAWLDKARTLARRSPRSVQLSLGVALEALSNAGLLDGFPCERERVAVVIGGQNISSAYQFAMFEKFSRERSFLPPSYGLHFLDTDHVGAVSELCGARGEGSTAGGASASGNVALIQGMRLIRAGVADVCVVVGAMADLSPVEAHALEQLGALGSIRWRDEPARACRPFDADRDGFIYGQGAAALVLESPAVAVRRGAAIQGLLLGGASCLEGNRSTELSAEGAARAMRAALHDAAIATEAVDYINAHATASKHGDGREIEALKAVLQRRLGDVRVNSTKALTGHCLWAAGAVEAVATLIQLRDGFLHGNPNLESPIDTECHFAGREWIQAKCAVALSNSFGFGGIYTSVVLSSPASAQWSPRLPEIR